MNGKPLLIRGHEPGLYVSEDGRVECAEHAPYKGTDTWRFGHYVRITPTFEKLWAENAAHFKDPERYHVPRCEVCGKTREEAERA